VVLHNTAAMDDSRMLGVVVIQHSGEGSSHSLLAHAPKDRISPAQRSHSGLIELVRVIALK